MAKIVLYHYVKMIQAVVPDDCPTDNYMSMDDWLFHNNKEKDVIKEDTRDYEIVDVVKDSEE